jgi:hypothetical protein
MQLDDTCSTSFSAERRSQRKIQRRFFFDAVLRIAERVLRRRRLWDELRRTFGNFTNSHLLRSWHFDSPLREANILTSVIKELLTDGSSGKIEEQ